MLAGFALALGLVLALCVGLLAARLRAMQAEMKKLEDQVLMLSIEVKDQDKKIAELRESNAAERPALAPALAQLASGGRSTNLVQAAVLFGGQLLAAYLRRRSRRDSDETE
ncbi:MAG TPA: hypothetical protein PLH94_09575 [Fimbriimonadaceae bacterium]|nr:hypothetical protein [Fimbriimonadaceae bacterium]